MAGFVDVNFIIVHGLFGVIYLEEKYFAREKEN